MSSLSFALPKGRPVAKGFYESMYPLLASKLCGMGTSRDTHDCDLYFWVSIREENSRDFDTEGNNS